MPIVMAQSVALPGGGGGGGFSPSSDPGLIAWYSADVGVTTSSGNVTAVADQSGHGYNLANTGTVPYSATGFNGHPTFNFLFANTATLKTATNTVALSGATASMYIVGQMLTATDTFGRAGVYVGNGASADYNNPDSAAWILRTADANEFSTTRATSNTCTTAISLATNLRLAAIFDGVNLTHYVNNVAGSSFAYSDVFGTAGNGTIWMGLCPDGNPWEGPISEFIITTNSGSLRSSYNTYFATHWGI